MYEWKELFKDGAKIAVAVVLGSLVLILVLTMAIWWVRVCIDFFNL